MISGGLGYFVARARSTQEVKQFGHNHLLFLKNRSQAKDFKRFRLFRICSATRLYEKHEIVAA
jgi:hypothetical protein